MNATQHLFTLQDLADRWKCSKGKVHRMWKAGEIKPAVESGRLVRFDLAAVEKSLAGKNDQALPLAGPTTENHV